MNEPSTEVLFPNPGVRLIEEDERCAVWEEFFQPGLATPPHRHLRDYVAAFPGGGELTVTHVAGELETYSLLNGAMEPLPTTEGSARFAIAPGTIIRSRVPAGGTCHIALNEGSTPLQMILMEFKQG